MSPTLKLYLELERLMLDLDERGDPHADRIRDMMDPLWHELSDAEHKLLDAREFRGLERVEYAHLYFGPALFAPPPQQERSGDPGIEIRDWRGAA